MKKLIMILVLITLTNVCIGQVTKLRATAYNVIFTDSDDWMGWEDTNFLIVIDVDNSRIQMYQNTDKTFDIIQYDLEKDTYGDSFIRSRAIDGEGKECDIRVYHVINKREQIYVTYPDYTIVFEVDYLD